MIIICFLHGFEINMDFLNKSQRIKFNVSTYHVPQISFNHRIFLMLMICFFNVIILSRSQRAEDVALIWLWPQSFWSINVFQWILDKIDKIQRTAFVNRPRTVHLQYLVWSLYFDLDWYSDHSASFFVKKLKDL